MVRRRRRVPGERVAIDAQVKTASKGSRPNVKHILRALLPYILLLPAYALIGAFLIYPILSNFYLSVFRWRLTSPGARVYIGLGNYQSLFAKPLFWESLRFTLLYTGLTVFISFLFGLACAMMLHRAHRLRRLLTPIFVMPFMVAPIAVGLTWRLLWNREFGPVNYLISLIGIGPINWLGDAHYAVIATMVSEVWRTAPFVMLLLLAGLVSIPDELFEAARVDGASGWRVFRSITLPLLAPAITVAVLFETIFKLRVFDMIYILTGGGPGTATTPLGLLTYQTYFRYLNGGESAAIAVILFAIGAVISAVYLRTIYRSWEA